MRYWLAVSTDQSSSDPTLPDSPTTPRLHPIRVATLMTLGILLLGLAFAADAPVREFVKREGTTGQINLGEFVSKYSEPQWLFCIGAMGWLISRFLQKPDWQRRWLIILAATAIAGIAVNIPRSITGRARPSNKIEQGWFGPKHNDQWLIGRNSYNSFPSGHTTTAAGFAFATFFCFRRFGWLAIPGAAWVGWARIWVSAHHFSDVAVGMAFGAVLAWCVWRWFLNRGWVEEKCRNTPSVKVS